MCSYNIIAKNKLRGHEFSALVDKYRSIFYTLHTSRILINGPLNDVAHPEDRKSHNCCKNDKNHMAIVVI